MHNFFQSPKEFLRNYRSKFRDCILDFIITMHLNARNSVHSLLQLTWEGSGDMGLVYCGTSVWNRGSIATTND